MAKDALDYFSYTLTKGWPLYPYAEDFCAGSAKPSVEPSVRSHAATPHRLRKDSVNTPRIVHSSYSSEVGPIDEKWSVQRREQVRRKREYKALLYMNNINKQVDITNK